MQRQAADLLAALPAGRDAALVLPPFSDGLPAAEAFLAPAQINYVGKAANLYDLGYTYHGSASVILRYMRMGYLWERVRVRGGAYGAFCMLDRMGGTLVCASYRDPNVDETLTAYDQMADYLRSFRPDKEQLTSAIVGAIGDLDSYLPAIWPRTTRTPASRCVTRSSAPRPGTSATSPTCWPKPPVTA